METQAKVLACSPVLFVHCTAMLSCLEIFSPLSLLLWTACYIQFLHLSFVFMLFVFVFVFIRRSGEISSPFSNCFYISDTSLHILELHCHVTLLIFFFNGDIYSVA